MRIDDGDGGCGFAESFIITHPGKSLFPDEDNGSIVKLLEQIAKTEVIPFSV